MGAVKNKNILILTSSHPHHASGVVALDLYRGLKAYQNNAVTLVTKAHDHFDDDNIVSFSSYLAQLNERVFRRLRNIFINPLRTNSDYYFFEFDQTKRYGQVNRLLKMVKQKPDVIIALFLTEFFTYQDLAEIKKQTGAKVILYPMDMEPFTGGCHYSWSCLGYAKNCGCCPGLNSNDPDDQSAKNLKIKKGYIDTDTEVFAGNKQILEQMRSSAIFRNHTIHESIFPVPDKSIFKFAKQAAVRKKWGIPADKLVLFIGSVSLTEKRKGIAELIESLKLLSKEGSELELLQKNILLIVAGNEQEGLTFPFETKYIGFLKKHTELAEVYQLADFFLSPSLEDAGPTMVLQSILCETPVIAFKIGFAAEFIEDGITGFLASDKSVSAYATALQKAVMLAPAERGEMKSNLKHLNQIIDADKVFDKIQKIIAA